MKSGRFAERRTPNEGDQLDILVVSHLFPPETGGVQRLAENLAIHSSHTITVLTSPTDNPEWDDQYDFDVERHPLTGPVGLLTQLLLLLIRGRQFDMIYFMRMEYAFLAAPARLLGVPVVAHAHGSELFSNGSRQHHAYLWCSFRILSHVVAISEWTKERLIELGVAESNITVVHNGVDYDRFHGSDASGLAWTADAETPVIVTVSRLTDRKGQDLVIEAMADLDQPVDYLVIGPGDATELEQLAHEHDVDDRVHFLGKVPEDDLPGYYALADGFVMPTRFVDGDIEGFGLVYLEANAAATPVIGSRTGGVPSAINDEETGLLCEPTVESVRNSLSRLLSDDDLRHRLGEQGDAWAQAHDWASMAQTWDTTLCSIAAD